MDCENHNSCKNNALCHLCDGTRLLKLPKEKKPLKKTGPKKKKEGMDFEKQVVKRYEQRIAQKGPKNRDVVIRRQPNSGAIWSMPGDITTEEALMECKERGSTTSKGEKQIAINKTWLEKIAYESRTSGKPYWYLPFHYKGDGDIYLVKDFDHELEMIHQIKILKERVQELEGQLNEGTD